MKLRIGTRKSKLAMAQAELVRDAIKGQFPAMEVELVPITTKGDKMLDRPLASFGGKGVFTRELEEALLRGEVDLAVHSAKDMPMEFPRGLALGAVLCREDPRDVLVTLSGTPARQLPAGSVVGTSSLRRELQMRRLNPQVKIRLLRGNVLTRLERLREGGYDGILLAAAGLKRLGLTEGAGIYFEYLEPEEFVPAPGQGILGVEIREGELAQVMAAIHSPMDGVMLQAEREYLSILGGGCNAPCGAYCRYDGGRLAMSVMFARDGKHPSFRRKTIRYPEGGILAELPGGGDFAAGHEGIKPVQAGGGLSEAKRLAQELARQVRMRPVSLVGAGPGDAGLLTRKGLACVRQADVILYDNLISGSILNEARLDAQLIYVGKRSHNHHLAQDEINRLLVEQAGEGKYVVRLKGGDPFIFGRGGEEALALQEKGIPFEVVPGVSSSYSVPAYGGIPVTHRHMASSFHVITGHEGDHKAEEALDYGTLAKEEGTLVFLMGLKSLDRITKQLLACGKDKATPAAVIQQGATARQKLVISTLGNVAEEAGRQGIGTPAITVVGPVVGLADKLSWYGAGVLSGKRVLATGSRYIAGELEKALEPYGAETVSVSVIESRPLWNEGLCQALEELEQYSWLVFTSSNGVDLFFDRLRGRRVDLRRLMHMKFVAIGQKTASALERHGFLCDFVPSGFSSADLAREWVGRLEKGQRVLLMRAKGGSPILARELAAAGICFSDVALYESWVDQRRKEEVNRAAREVDYLVVASGSAVKALCGMLEEKEGLAAKVVSIGPSTTEMARQMGLPVYATAAEYTSEGIAAVILADSLADAARERAGRGNART